MTRTLILVSVAFFLLVDCTPSPCSPRAAAAIDAACATAVVETLTEACPDVDAERVGLEAALVQCPQAAAVLAMCDEAIASHAELCSK
jgi:hypothetical protein